MFPIKSKVSVLKDSCNSSLGVLLRAYTDETTSTKNTIYIQHLVGRLQPVRAAGFADSSNQVNAQTHMRIRFSIAVPTASREIG